MINVVCVLRAGGKVGYDSSWVEKLKNSVARNLTIPHRFISLSDVEVPSERIPLELLPGSPRGFWYKMQLFKHSEFVNTPTIYFDLDLVICQNIDQEVTKLISQPKFVMLWEDNSHRVDVPSTSNSSIMFWNGDYRHLWNKFISNPEMYYIKHEDRASFGDQGFIKENVNHELLHNLIGKEKICWVDKKQKEPDTTKFLIFTKPSRKPSKYQGHHLVSKHWV